jgi:uncharacterized membrane protein
MAGEIEHGRDLDRVSAFSDGVFAIAITVLVLSIDIPNVSDKELPDVLDTLIRPVFAYFLSFYVIGVFWFTHHRMWHFIRRVDGRFIAINMVLLSLIALLPFPTDLMGDYGNTVEATSIYAGAVAATGLTSVSLWWYVSKDNRLLREDTPADYTRLALRRGLAVPAVFLLSIPIAFVSADLAKASWLLLWPLHAMIGSARNVYDL